MSHCEYCGVDERYGPCTCREDKKLAFIAQDIKEKRCRVCVRLAPVYNSFCKGCLDGSNFKAVEGVEDKKEEVIGVLELNIDNNKIRAFSTFDDVINKYVELEALRISIEQSLQSIRRKQGPNENWSTDIGKDERPAVQLLWKAHQDCTTDLAVLRNMVINNEMHITLRMGGKVFPVRVYESKDDIILEVPDGVDFNVLQTRIKLKTDSCQFPV